MLSIQIPTIVSRSHVFKPLLAELKRQSEPFGDKIEILHLTDEKEMPIAQKRTNLYEMSSMPYSVQWDDDDWIHPIGINLIMNALSSKPDCVTYKMISEFDGIPQKRQPGPLHRTIFRRKYKKAARNVDGFDIVHPPCNKNVIRTDLAIKASKMLPQTQRYGEDGDFAKEVVRLVKKEIFIDKHIYWYLNLSGEEWSRERYGLSENDLFNEQNKLI